MEPVDVTEQDLFTAPLEAKPTVFLFNPFTEAWIAHGKAFTPVKRQALLAEDLANLPQFLCDPGDVVLLKEPPSPGFLNLLTQAGFPSPEFVELREGRINPAEDICHRELAGLRPWAWGPDSVELLKPLFPQLGSEARTAYNPPYNEEIAQLYSKAWSANFLRTVLAHCRRFDDMSPAKAETQRSRSAAAARWLCSDQETGIAVDNLQDAFAAVAAIRSRGHHRVVVKQAYGLAGQNTIRLWEPEVLPAQRLWMANILTEGRHLLVEPWLERELDFSVQLEMGSSGLKLCGYTGLINDLKGQFLANWADADYRRSCPRKVAACFHPQADVSGCFLRLYEEIFSLLEAELRRVGFIGPISLDSLIYRTPQGDRRLKPIVEINPRYTMGRLTIELMKHASPGSGGLFRPVTLAQARKSGFADLASYASAFSQHLSLRIEGKLTPKIRQGAICLNDPRQAQVCLATFQLGSAVN
jgi:hypothetical protein